MTRLPFWLSLTITLVSLLLFTSCDPTVKQPPAVAACQPDIQYLTRLDRNDFRVKTVPEGCATETMLRQQRYVAAPANKELTLHIYTNYTPGWYLRVFGMRAGQAPVSLLACEKRTVNYASVPVAYPNEPVFDSLLVEVAYNAGRDNEEGIREDHFFAIDVYDKAPTESPEDLKRGYAISCDGQATDQVVISTCDRAGNLGDWAREMGLTVVDSFGRGDSEVIIGRPPTGMETNTTPPTSTASTIRRDGSNGINTERDYLIFEEKTFANPGFNDQGDEAIIKRYDCLAYAPRNGEDGAIMVTIIDSGVETGNQPNKNWGLFAFDGYRASTAYLQPGTLGYDFFRNGPTPEDEVGHGTAVAGAVIGQYGGKMRLNLVNHKIFGVDADTVYATYAGAVEATYAAIDHGSDIINMSWGREMAEPTEALGCAIRLAGIEGITVVTTAGNDTTNIGQLPQWPAAFAGKPGYENLIAVGSFFYNGLAPDTKQSTRADYSNFSKDNITAYAYLTTQVPGFRVDTLGFQFGTSISAPIVVRELATALANNGAARVDFDQQSEAGIFFPTGKRDRFNQEISAHEVMILPVGCGKDRP